MIFVNNIELREDVNGDNFSVLTLTTPNTQLIKLANGSFQEVMCKPEKVTLNVWHGYENRGVEREASKDYFNYLVNATQGSYLNGCIIDVEHEPIKVELDNGIFTKTSSKVFVPVQPNEVGFNQVVIKSCKVFQIVPTNAEYKSKNSFTPKQVKQVEAGIQDPNA